MTANTEVFTPILDDNDVLKISEQENIQNTQPKDLLESETNDLKTEYEIESNGHEQEADVNYLSRQSKVTELKLPVEEDELVREYRQTLQQSHTENVKNSPQISLEAQTGFNDSQAYENPIITGLVTAKSSTNVLEPITNSANTSSEISATDLRKYRCFKYLFRLASTCNSKLELSNKVHEAYVRTYKKIKFTIAINHNLGVLKYCFYYFCSGTNMAMGYLLKLSGTGRNHQMQTSQRQFTNKSKTGTN